MGAVSWGFTLYFGRDETGRNLKKRFLRAIASYTLYGESLKSPTGFHGIWLKIPESERGSANYGIGIRGSQLSFTTDMHIQFEEHFVLDDIMLAVAQKMEPACAISVTEARETDNEHSAMFYRDPYFFLLELPVISSHTTIEDFLEDEEALQKISEIKKVLPLDELIAILRQHCKQVFVGKRGVGIMKGDYSPEEACVYPHYFLRQLVRSRGVSLDEGFAEKYAREFGVK